MQLRTTTTPLEALGVVILCFGLFIASSTYAVLSFHDGGGGAGSGTAGSFTEEGFISLVVTELVLGLVAMYVLRGRGFDIASLYPRPSVSGAGVGVLLYVAAAGVGWLCMLPFVEQQYQEPLQRLTSGAQIGVPVLVLLGIVNGSYEEIFLLGFLLRGLRGYGLATAIGISVLVRILYHLYQGPLGALSISAYGLVVSLYFVASSRLFPAVLAHALGDIVPFLFWS